ncbi:MAG: N-acetylneuraminate synthase family protein [Cyanobium sp.]
MSRAPVLSLGDRLVGADSPCLLIAEVAQAHDGSLGMAHAFLDAAAEAGADAIKFQTHLAEAESTLDEPFRIAFSRQDESRYAYWRRMQFTAEQWAGLAEHARQRGLLFLSSPFSEAAVRLLADLGVPGWKVGSGEALGSALVEAMVAAGGPILLSTGMSRWQEIDAAVASLEQRGVPHALLQCTSRYPTPLEEVGLNVLAQMRQRYRCPVGLSDHSGSIFPALAALARGCDLLEVHVTFDRRMFGPDASASLTFEEFSRIRQARDAFQQIDGHPVDKDAMAESMATMRATFGKSLAPARVLEAGTVLDASMIVMKKPATGLQASDLDTVLGRRLVRTVHPERLLQWSDLEP